MQSLTINSIVYLLGAVLGAILYGVSISHARAAKKKARPPYQNAATYGLAMVLIFPVLAVASSVLAVLSNLYAPWFENLYTSWIDPALLAILVSLTISWAACELTGHSHELSLTSVAVQLRRKAIALVLTSIQIPAGKRISVSTLQQTALTQLLGSRAVTDLLLTSQQKRGEVEIRNFFQAFKVDDNDFRGDLELMAKDGIIKIFDSPKAGNALNATALARWPGEKLYVEFSDGRPELK